MMKYKVIGKYCDGMPTSIYTKTETYSEACVKYYEAQNEGWYALEIKEIRE